MPPMMFTYRSLLRVETVLVAAAIVGGVAAWWLSGL